MHPIKQLFLGSAIGIALGLIIAISVPNCEMVDPPSPAPSKQEKVTVWQGKIGDQEIVIIQKEIKNY